MTVSYYFKSSYFKRVLKQITKEKFKTTERLFNKTNKT